MADNAFVKIGTALLKHQVKKLVGEEAMGVIGAELADIGGDKLDAWLGDKSTIAEIERAAKTAEACFHDAVGDHELAQWMVSLPIGDLPKVLEAIEELPTSPDEKQLENEIRSAVAGWRKLSSQQSEIAVNAFMSCLRNALLPIEKQTLMVIGRAVLRTEDKVDLLLRWFEQYIITGKSDANFLDNLTKQAETSNSLSQRENENNKIQDMVADGVNWEVASSSTIFEIRLQNAFPGLRSIEKFDKEEAVNRLQVLLHSPLGVETSLGGQRLPFWWLRGISSAQIDRFEKTGAHRILLNYFDMDVDYIVAVRRFPEEGKNFVYVHVTPDQPTGLYEYRESWIEEYLQFQLEHDSGYYYREEYGLWNGRLIKREEYDDGAAIVDGTPTNITGAELRIRYITPYNFIICAGNHVLMSQLPLSDAAEKNNKLLNEILLDKKGIGDLVDFIGSLTNFSHFPNNW